MNLKRLFNMNLFKVFNINFLKENIKKSKGLLAFFFGIIPLINCLILTIISISLKNEIEILDFSTLSLTTYMGLYIIPIVLAVSLFGFVFKSKSVDFVLSKPINRKSIYITNILGGIIIITIFMLLNSLIYALFGLVFSNLIIPFNMILDYFIFFLVSYIFIFIVSSLAISLAGNLMGSIVVILLITCLYPFFSILNIYYYETNNIVTYIKYDKSYEPENYTCGSNSDCLKHLEKNEYRISSSKNHEATYTAPFYSLNSSNDSFYNSKSLIKMFILIPIYCIIGFYIFQKRKMENNETNFKNPKMHYFIKKLTLIPVSFVCYLIIKEADEIGFIISLFVIEIYSVLYDLITRKEIYKFLKSSIASLITLGLLLGVFGLYDFYLDDNSEAIKEIKEIEINDDISIKKDKKYNINNKNITGEELINSIIKDTISKNHEIKGGVSYLKTKTNKGSYYLGLFLNMENDNILQEIKKQEQLKYFKNYNYNQIDYTGTYLKPTKKLKNLIKDTMTNIDEYKYDNDYLLPVKTYKNHKLESFYIMPTLNKDLDSYIIKERNKQAVEFLEKNTYLNYGTSEDYDIIDYILRKNKPSFINYLKNNNNEITTNSMYIYAYYNENLTILIGDKEKFEQELEKYKQKLENDQEFQNILNNYENYTEAVNEEDKDNIENNEY